jgi:stage II sporulation protein AA (anti-sigma F factor antagonist)
MDVRPSAETVTSQGGVIMDAEEVVIERDRGAWVLTLRGEHDLSTATALRNALGDVFDAGSAVVVDLSDVTFMDSSTLNAILYGSERAQSDDAHRFAAVLPPGPSAARRVLELTGVDRVLAIHPDRASAVAAIAGDGGVSTAK